MTQLESRLQALNAAAVHNYLDPFVAIKWDEPDLAVAAHDERWLNVMFDPISRTEWFRDQPLDRKIEFAMARHCAFALFGIEFESSLQISLLLYIRRLPTTSSEVRFLYHEIREEAQHSQMFQEFVRRVAAGVPSVPIPFCLDGQYSRIFQDRVLGLLAEADTLPEELLFGVLAVEYPSDRLQRAYLALDPSKSVPLVRAVHELHVADEARHLRYARMMLADRLRQLQPRAMNRLRYIAPGLFRLALEALVRTPRHLVDAFGVPIDVLESPAYLDSLRTSMTFAGEPLVRYSRRVGLLTDRTAPLWARVT